jgi:hypothetical protein
MKDTTQLIYGIALTAGLLGPVILGLMSIRKAMLLDELPRWLSATAAFGALGASLLFLFEIWSERLGWHNPYPRAYLYLLIALAILGATFWTLSTILTRYKPYPYDYISLYSFILAIPFGLLTYWVANAILG